ATAVYGSRGANGVILVTTKSPQEKMTVNFNSFMSVKTIAKKPSMLKPYEFAQLANDYGQEYFTSKGEAPVVYYSEAELQEFKDGTNPGFNYFDAITKDPAYTQNYELSLSGGTDKLSVLASTRYNKSEGVIKHNSKELYNYRLKADAKVKTWLDAGVNIFGRYTDHKGPRLAKYNGALIGAMFYPVTRGPYDENGDYINTYPLSGSPVINPIALVEEADNKFTYQHNQIQGYLNFKILDGLTFRTQVGLSLTNEHNTESYNSKSYEAFANSLTKAYAYSNKGTVFLNTNTLNYIKEFNKNHRINLTAVHEQYSSKIYWHKSTARGLHFEDLGDNALGWADSNKSEVESEKIISTLQSWMLRANYALMNRYMLTASIRGDGTSRLAKKWDYFPSMSVAWDILQENFMDNVEAMSQFKLRLGYGVVGNQAIAPYQMYSQMGPVPTATGGTSYVSVRPAGDNLGWERNEQLNAGLDMGFFNGRLAVNIDLYKRASKKLLLELQQPVHVGYTK
ncbi:MAG: SusC/RagA family TonB-linked outer membrane protein, partial [Bacteroides sp.]